MKGAVSILSVVLFALAVCYATGLAVRFLRPFVATPPEPAP